MSIPLELKTLSLLHTKTTPSVNDAQSVAWQLMFVMKCPPHNVLSLKVFFFKLIVGNNFDVISIVKHAILTFSHKVATSQKMVVGYILGLAKVITKIMRCGKWT